MDADDLEADLSAPDVDLAADTLGLRTRDGTLVAGGFVLPRGHLEAQFAEGWDSPELQSRLVDFGENRGRQRGLDAVFQFLAEADTEGAARLIARGYRLAYTAWILRLDSDTPIHGRDLPPGYAVRPFALDDAEATFVVIRDAFGEWDTAPERNFASWRARARFDRPHVDPSAFRVATYQGEVIGAVHRVRLRRRGLGGPARGGQAAPRSGRGPAAARRQRTPPPGPAVCRTPG